MSERIDVIYPTRDPLVEESMDVIAILCLEVEPPALNNSVVGATKEDMRFKASFGILGVEAFSELRNVFKGKPWMQSIQE